MQKKSSSFYVFELLTAVDYIGLVDVLKISCKCKTKKNPLCNKCIINNNFSHKILFYFTCGMRIPVQMGW
jgi:hypothetical protein